MIGRFEVFTLALSELTSSWNKIAAEEMKVYGLKGSCVIYLIALYKIAEGLTAANLCEMSKCNAVFSLLQRSDGCNHRINTLLPESRY